MSYFGGLFGSYFGDYFGTAGGASPVITPEGDCPPVARLLSRLVTRFNTPNRRGLLRAFAKPACEIEAMFLDLIAQVGIDDSTGIQLDVIGKIVGQKRAGLVDADYRRFLRARIVANRSSGAIDTLYRVARLVINDATARLQVVNDGNASLTFYVSGLVVTGLARTALTTLLRAAGAAGVRMWIQTTTVPDSEAFTLSVATEMTTGDSVGSGAIHVATTSSFPAAGTLIIAEGDIVAARQETVDYISKLAGVFFLSPSTPLAFTHTTGTIVALQSSPGRGFSPSALTTPGSIAAGSATITVDDCSTFPAAGTLQIDAGTANSEELAYSSRTGTVFTLIGTSGFSHIVGTLVTSVDAGGALDAVTVL